MSLNLLPSQAKFQVERMQAIALSRKILTIYLVAWVIITAIIFASEQGVIWWLKQENNKYQAIVADFLQSSSEIVTSQTIKFRAKLLGKVLADRFEYSDAFNIVGSIFDSNLVVKNFELKERTYFAMTIVASDAAAMKSLESKVDEINSGVDPKIKKIVLQSASYSKISREWLVSMEVYLK